MNSDRQVILISGGSRGLGCALVADLLERGNVVATFSRSRTPFIETCQRNDPEGKSFIWEAIDLADYELMRKFVMTVKQRYGRIDTLINNAGVAVDGLLTLMRFSDIHREITLNLEGTVYITQVCSKIMLEQQGGCIINISSIAGIRGYTGISVYSATKAALDGLTRSLARELGPRGIRVNSIAPGYFESEMVKSLTMEMRNQIMRRTPLGRFGTVDDLVGVVRFMISPEARFITGQTLVVDGGNSC